LKYNRFPLGSIERLEEHWSPGRVAYHLATTESGRPRLQVTTTHINELTLDIPSEVASTIDDAPLSVVLAYPDGQRRHLRSRTTRSPGIRTDRIAAGIT
jgi:histidinol-phosphate/aromatic aminotransferase/cobyric acid decarboxylase-like protein